jgi:hypothetical protein
MAAEELADLVAVDAKLKKINAELKGTVLARGSTLLEVHGIGPAGAARILADVGDVARFADRNRFASWTGTAPLDASSGEQIRHRHSRAGNRRLNHVLHIAAIVQLRNDTEGRAHYRRKLAAGKTPMEALRCLKRQVSDVIFRRLVADARERAGSHWPGHGPGRALRGDSKIQRGRPAPAHRHFGSATSRTRSADATPDTTTPETEREASTQTSPLTQRGARSGRLREPCCRWSVK